MKRKERKAQKLKRKNFLPLLVITVIFWLLLGAIIYFLSPDAFGAVFLLFLVIFLTVFFTSSILFANSKRGGVIATSITLFIFLRFIGVGNIVNLLLLVGIVVTIELYFFKK